MQSEPILADIFRCSATGSSIKKPVFMRVFGHFEAWDAVGYDLNFLTPKGETGGSIPFWRVRRPWSFIGQRSSLDIELLPGPAGLYFPSGEIV